MTACNEWECEHNKNGQCETVQRMSECVENAIHEILEEKRKKELTE
jgi:hypothetical protein